MRCSTVWLYGPRGEPPAVVATAVGCCAPPVRRLRAAAGCGHRKRSQAQHTAIRAPARTKIACAAAAAESAAHDTRPAATLIIHDDETSQFGVWQGAFLSSRP
jgi:hypothetical protein